MRIEALMTTLATTCAPQETLSQALKKMQGAGCPFLPVTAGGGSRRLVGVITDGDIRMAAQLRDRNLDEVRVSHAMARDVRVCNPEDSVFEAEAIMLEAGIARLPVVDQFGRLLGVVALADVAREAEREREALSARITAAQFGLSVPRFAETHQLGRPARLAKPARVPA